MSRKLLEHCCSRNTEHLILGSYCGGENTPRCVQLTIRSGDYVQMTFAEAKSVFEQMIKAIEKIEKEYDSNQPWWEELMERVNK